MRCCRWSPLVLVICLTLGSVAYTFTGSNVQIPSKSGSHGVASSARSILLNLRSLEGENACAGRQNIRVRPLSSAEAEEEEEYEDSCMEQFIAAAEIFARRKAEEAQQALQRLRGGGKTKEAKDGDKQDAEEDTDDEGSDPCKRMQGSDEDEDDEQHTNTQEGKETNTKTAGQSKPDPKMSKADGKEGNKATKGEEGVDQQGSSELSVSRSLGSISAEDSRELDLEGESFSSNTMRLARQARMGQGDDDDNVDDSEDLRLLHKAARMTEYKAPASDDEDDDNENDSGSKKESEGKGEGGHGKKMRKRASSTKTQGEENDAENDDEDKDPSHEESADEEPEEEGGESEGGEEEKDVKSKVHEPKSKKRKPS